jgi:dihydrofolate synthase/folylpolyglutamate synthase
LSRLAPELASYAAALSRLHGLARLGVRPGLARIGRLMERLGDPQDRFVSLHVAGTNGKGSTAAFLAAVLQAAGHRTGLYTSPHLCRFTERIQVDGREIPEAAVIAGLARALEVEPELTFFEAATALAFQHFAEQGVEVAVVETGMGGALDATNLVRPRVSVLTRIDLDHLDIIGPDLPSVAREKAGIIKAGAPAVSAPALPAVQAALELRCAEVGTRLLLAGRDFFWRRERDGLCVEGEAEGPRRGLQLSLAGEHQDENAALCVVALARSGLRFSDQALRRGLATARWPGRLELAAGVLLDGAHNASAARALAAYLAGLERRFTIVMGMLGPRRPEEVMGPLVPHAERFLLTRPRSPRALPPEALEPHTTGVPAELFGTLAPALDRARDLGAPVLVTGSLYLVGEARGLLLAEPADPVLTADPLPGR